MRRRGSSPPDRLTDRQDRKITYARISVTDRCNLRCRYCMPEEGVSTAQMERILSWEELLRIVRVLVGCGIEKIRITGGEASCRKGLVDFVAEAGRCIGSGEIHLTSNGVGLSRLVPELERAGLAGVNLSLDTLSPERFTRLTGRDALEYVLDTLDALLASAMRIKINTVVLDGVNSDELPRIARLAEDNPIDVRFIEKMEFPGATGLPGRVVRAREIGEILSRSFPGIASLPGTNGTARLYRIPGFAGRIGTIAAYSRSFCSGCNRIRITADGNLKTCLYGSSKLDIRSLLRRGLGDEALAVALREAVTRKERDGRAARREDGAKENLPMYGIGG